MPPDASNNAAGQPGTPGKGNDGAYLDLHLPARMAELPGLLDAVEAFCSRMELSPRVSYNLALTLDELVTNAINYGYPCGEKRCQGSVRILVEFPGAVLKVTVEDDGEPFNPLEYPAPPEDTCERLSREGGLGIHLVRSLMDGAQYTRANGKNIMTMWKKVD